MKHIHCPSCNYPIYESDFENASEDRMSQKEIDKILDTTPNPAVRKILDRLIKEPFGELKLTQEEIETLEARSEI